MARRRGTRWPLNRNQSVYTMHKVSDLGLSDDEGDDS